MNSILYSIFRLRSEISESDKKRFVQFALLLGAVLAGFQAIDGAHGLGYVYFSGLVAFTLLLALSFFPVSLSWSTHGLLGVSLLCGFVLAMQTGGIYSPTLLWLAIIPNLALFVLHQKATLLWVLFVMCILFITAKLTNLSALTNTDVTSHSPGIWATSHLIGVQLCAMLIHWLHDWQYRRKSQRVDASIRRMKGVKQHLEMTESYKDRFLANVSEDLRAPMNAILGYSDVLADKAKYKPALTDTVHHIRSSIKQLLELTNSILDHAQLIEGKLKLTFKPVSVEELVQEQWANWNGKEGVQFQVQVDTAMPQWLLCDPQRLRQIIRILLSNASKFTQQGHVKLAFSYPNQQLKIDVHDTGIGISEEVKTYIFKRFEQGDGRLGYEFGGIGLGLPNALELTSLFGGSMGFESHDNQGSHFWVELPISAHSCETDQAAAQVQFNATQACRILVVDDQAVSMLVTIQTLRRMLPFAELASAASGQEAIDYLEQNTVDLVLMDVWMPDMDGPNTCSHLLRNQTQLARPPMVIGLTASTHPKDRLRCLDAGMHDVIIKPLDPQHVFQVVSRALAAQQSSGIYSQGHV